MRSALILVLGGVILAYGCAVEGSGTAGSGGNAGGAAGFGGSSGSAGAGTGGAAGSAAGGSGGSAATGGSGTGGGSTGGVGGGTGGSGTGGSGAGGAGTGGSGTGGSGTGGSGTGGSGAGGPGDAMPDVTFTYDAGIEDDAALNQDSACATGTASAELVPLDLYIMLDRSGSMRLPQADYPDGDCNVGQNVNSRWCYAVNALAGYFNDPGSAGTAVGLQYFPANCTITCGFFNCTTDCCTSGGCCQGGAQAVAAVPLGELPGNAAALVASLNAEIGQGGSTPTESALRGIAGYTAGNRRVGRQMVGVLITDGVPEGCNTNTNQLAQIAGDHLAATGIKTFVIGMEGADFNVLEAIAQAGGAASHSSYCASGINPCHFYNVGTGSSQPLIDALRDIQQSAVGCTYAMPVPQQGVVNPDNVNIEYTAGGVGTPQQVGRVQDATSCAPGGWYYDNNASPTTITLCPATCTTVQADTAAKIDILLGCLGS